MKRFCCLLIVTLSYGCGSLGKGNSFQLTMPDQSTVEQVHVDCRASSRTFPLPEPKEVSISDPQAIAAVLKAVAATSYDWSTWGITTLPAPAKRISFRGAIQERMWLGASEDFSVIWNRNGYKKLSEAERSPLVKALPEC
jgi:hypothetical protein